MSIPTDSMSPEFYESEMPLVEMEHIGLVYF